MGPSRTRKHVIRFQAEWLELARKYSWSKNNRDLLYKFIDLRPNHIIVDVGCGTGALTRVLAEKIDRNIGGRIVGIDKDRELLRSAVAITKKAGLNDVVSFRLANATKAIPLPDNYSDRVVSQAFLRWLAPEELKRSMEEMIRICKRGGLVVACERSIDTSILYYPLNNRLTKLSRKMGLAQILGYEKLYGYDKNIGYKIPSLFRKLGLTRIRLDGFSYGRVACDDRIPDEYKMDMIRYDSQKTEEFIKRLERAPDTKKRIQIARKSYLPLLKGGMTLKEIIELSKGQLSHHQKILRNPEQISEDTSVDVGVLFVTTGLKV